MYDWAVKSTGAGQQRNSLGLRYRLGCGGSCDVGSVAVQGLDVFGFVGCCTRG